MTRTIVKGETDNWFYNLPFSGFQSANSALNGNIGMVWKKNENWSFRLMAASGFRTPNIDDLAKVFDSEPGKVIVPNPELKPEYAYSL